MSSDDSIQLLVGPEKKPVTASRLALMAASPVFNNMLKPGFKEGAQSEVELPEDDADAIGHIVNFITHYTGIEPAPRDLAPLWTLADKYEMRAAEHLVLSALRWSCKAGKEELRAWASSPADKINVVRACLKADDHDLFRKVTARFVLCWDRSSLPEIGNSEDEEEEIAIALGLHGQASIIYGKMAVTMRHVLSHAGELREGISLSTWHDLCEDLGGLFDSHSGPSDKSVEGLFDELQQRWEWNTRFRPRLREKFGRLMAKGKLPFGPIELPADLGTSYKLYREGIAGLCLDCFKGSLGKGDGCVRPRCNLLTLLVEDSLCYEHIEW